MDFVTVSTGLISPYWMGLPIRYIQFLVDLQFDYCQNTLPFSYSISSQITPLSNMNLTLPLASSLILSYNLPAL